MKQSTQDTLAPVISFLRSFEVLDETPGLKFLLAGNDFVHFHDDPDGLWADVKLSKGRIRLPVATAAEQAALMEQISGKLDALASHNRRNQRQKRH